jgi:hypothetical protein
MIPDFPENYGIYISGGAAAGITLCIASLLKD